VTCLVKIYGGLQLGGYHEHSTGIYTDRLVHKFTEFTEAITAEDTDDINRHGLSPYIAYYLKSQHISLYVSGSSSK